jgi:hypothetical protein
MDVETVRFVVNSTLNMGLGPIPLDRVRPYVTDVPSLVWTVPSCFQSNAVGLKQGESFVVEFQFIFVSQ